MHDTPKFANHVTINSSTLDDIIYLIIAIMTSKGRLVILALPEQGEVKGKKGCHI